MLAWHGRGMAMVLVALVLFAAPSLSDETRIEPQLVVQTGHANAYGWPECTAISPDNRLLATGSENVCLWEVAGGRELRRLRGHASKVSALVWSPDGKTLVSGSEDGTARLWEAQSGRELQRIEAKSAVRALAFSPDGKMLLAGGLFGTLLWDVAEQKIIEQLQPSGYCAAFSPDGRVFATGSGFNQVLLFDAATRQVLHRLELPLGQSAASVAFSPDNRLLATTARSFAGQGGQLWDVVTGASVLKFEGGGFAAFLPDGKSLVTEGKDNSFSVREAASGKEERRFGRGYGAAALSSDGKLLAAGGGDGTNVWDIVAGREVQTLHGAAAPINSVAFVPPAPGEPPMALIGPSMWDLTSGRLAHQFTEPDSAWHESAISADGRIVAIAEDVSVTLYRTRPTAKDLSDEIGRFDGKAPCALSPDGKWLVAYENEMTTTQDNHVLHLYDVATQKEIRRLILKDLAIRIAFSPDGTRILVAGWHGTAVIFDATSGQVLHRLEGHIGVVNAAAFSPDGRRVLTGSSSLFTDHDDTLRLWDAATGKLIWKVERPKGLNSAAFSLDGKRLAAGDWNGDIVLCEAQSGKVLRTLSGHSYAVESVAFSPDGRFLLSASLDRTQRFWNVESGQELCRIVSAQDTIGRPTASWTVVDGEGRFDTNDFDHQKTLHWILPDAPNEPLPLETFFRQYYEPRLLGRALAGEALPPVPPIGELNPVRPFVSITKIEPQPDDSGMVNVTVEVTATQKTVTHGGDARVLTSGAQDLRLFRNGQLVRAFPSDGSTLKLDATTHKYNATFEKIRLPALAGPNADAQIEFSAYAFNSDGIKSETARRAFKDARRYKPHQSRVYVITMGVNVYETPSWNLSFAASDARLLAAVLKKQWPEAITISLVSDSPGDASGSAPQAAPDGGENSAATKANFKAILDLLAGKPVDERIKKSLRGAEKIRAAGPNDLVFISFAGHGYADAQNNFYLLPHDIGAGQTTITPQLLERCISSEELSSWLREVDAGEMVMVVDACQSAASVQANGFKPGPMDSRGLGQLAYDKGMRILAASQAGDVALESRRVRQGLLTYALVREGLEAKRADRAPQDEAVTLREWLGYALWRVPNLAEEVRRGAVQQFGDIGGRNVRLDAPDGRRNPVKSITQQPSLFDFAGHDGIYLITPSWATLGSGTDTAPVEPSDDD